MPNKPPVRFSAVLATVAAGLAALDAGDVIKLADLFDDAVDACEGDGRKLDLSALVAAAPAGVRGVLNELAQAIMREGAYRGDNWSKTWLVPAIRQLCPCFAG